MSGNKQSDWVLARADCTLQKMFEDISDAMRLDIQKFNALPPEKRPDRLFTHDSENGKFRVFRAVRSPLGGLGTTETEPRVSVRKTINSIEVCPNGQASLEITHAWNEETLSCDFLVEGVSLPTWCISQKFLVGFMFED